MSFCLSINYYDMICEYGKDKNRDQPAVFLAQIHQQMVLLFLSFLFHLCRNTKWTCLLTKYQSIHSDFPTCKTQTKQRPAYESCKFTEGVEMRRERKNRLLWQEKQQFFASFATWFWDINVVWNFIKRQSKQVLKQWKCRFR